MQLSWTAPSDAGGTAAVAGYEVRYAKAQITDDTAFNAATAVTYTGVPAQPGQPDGILVDTLYIENGYFFAIKSRDAGGNLSPLIATTTGMPRARQASNTMRSLARRPSIVSFKRPSRSPSYGSAPAR